MNEQRTIIVVWSWNTAGLGEGTWHVEGTMHANDRLICRDWPVRGRDYLPALQALLDQYSRAGGEVMLFLHRHHGYHQEHVKALLAAPLRPDQGKRQVFLFGEGADAIYLTGTPRGLLGTSGTFSAQLQKEDRLLDRTSVADTERRMLKATHFEHVWELYQLALRRRIFELKEDFFDFLGHYLPRSAFEPGELYTLLNQPEHRELLLRLLSFVGRVREGSNLATEIRTFERNTNRTLTFDDCGIQLESSAGTPAAEEYQALKVYVLRYVLAKGGPVAPLELHERFMTLLTKIPGLTYYS